MMNDKDNLPPLPNVSLPPIPVDLIEEEGKEVIEKAVQKKSSIVDETFESKMSLTIGSSFIGFMALLLMFSPFYSKEVKYRFKDLDESSRFTLLDSREKSFQEGVSVTLKKALKKEVFYMGTNFPFSGKVYASFESVPKQILAHEPVSFETSSVLENGVAKFSVMKMTQGLKVISGRYKYVLKIYPSGYHYRLKKWLSHFGLRFNTQEYDGLTVNGETIIYGGGDRAFKRKLKKFKEVTKKRIVGPLEERVGRYDTFLQLLEKTRRHFEQALSKSKKPKDMELFEELYNKDVGPFLTDLITDSNRLHLSYLNIDPERSKAYEKLFILGKKIGGVASDMATESKKLNIKNKKQFKEKFSIVIKEITEEIATEKLLIQSELKKYL